MQITWGKGNPDMTCGELRSSIKHANTDVLHVQGIRGDNIV
jgi:hypothetical protein